MIEYPTRPSAPPPAAGLAIPDCSESETVRSTHRAKALLGYERATPDHLPTCTRCGRLCDVGALYCPECGSSLTLLRTGLPK